MKKIITFCVCCILLLAVAACGQGGQPETTPSPSPTASPTPPNGNENGGDEEMTGDEEKGIPDENGFEFTHTHNEELVAAFTPDGAVINADIESFLALTTEKSMDEMIDFVLAVAEELGVTLVEIEEPRPDNWVYKGVLEDGMPIQVELRDDGLYTSMMVLY